MEKDSLEVALVQAPLIWENPEANRAVFSKKLKAINTGIDVIILPEMFTTGFTMTPENSSKEEQQRTLEWMQDWAVQKNCAIVGSMVYAEKELFYNRLWFVTPDSKTYYDKKHTFTLAGEDKVYKAGAQKVIISFRGFRICPLICYDLRFPVWARNIEDYDLVLYVANWPKPRINAWDTLLRARAIENMAYCIGVNRVGTDALGHEYSGHSAAYDVLGNRICYSEKEETCYAELSLAELKKYRNKLRFLEDRDPFSFQ